MANKIRVLLADDQLMVRCGISLLLQQESDMEVVAEAGGGAEAIEDVKRLRPDVVLMDIDLPCTSGLDATKRITTAVPEASVLVLTVYDREEFLFQALQAGALGFMLKSANVKELLTAIRTVHSGEAFIYPRMATKLVGDYLRRLKLARGDDSYGRLSTREREVLPMLAESPNNGEIAGKLHLSPFTVQTYRQRVMRKLDLHSRTELLRYALRRRIVNLE